MPSACAGRKPAHGPVRTARSVVLAQPSARRKVSGRIAALRERGLWPRGASAPMSTRAAGSAPWIAGPGLAREAPVEVRRVGLADRARARELRLQPQRQVRLVPDDVAVDVGAVAQRDGARVAAEQVGAAA